MDPRISEFQCIMPIVNIPSVRAHGILSYEGTAKLPHLSVAMPEVQERRDQKHVPGGLKLHQYANLYFHARNPMLFKRRGQAEELCVLRIAIGIAQEPGVVFADCNASSDYVRFLHPKQWSLLDLDSIYAMDWRHPDDQVAYYRHRSRKCAEVLVPKCVPPSFVSGAYVVNERARTNLLAQQFKLPITIDPHLFFR